MVLDVDVTRSDGWLMRTLSPLGDACRLREPDHLRYKKPRFRVFGSFIKLSLACPDAFIWGSTRLKHVLRVRSHVYFPKQVSGVAWSLDDKFTILADGRCSALVPWLLTSRSGRGSPSLGSGLYIVVPGMTAVLSATDILRKDRGMASMDDNAIKYLLHLSPLSFNVR